MPWIRRQSQPRSPYWAAALLALAALGLGLLVGYTQWGATAAIVTLVEKELADTQAHIKTLEKRMSDMEARLMGDEPSGSTTDAKVKKSDGKAVRERTKGEKEKPTWNSESRF